jgi:hypothetical protein
VIINTYLLEDDELDDELLEECELLLLLLLCDDELLDELLEECELLLEELEEEELEEELQKRR